MEFNLEGIDLTSDTASTDIIARVAAHVLGLKNKNTDLIERERVAKADLEQSKLDTEQVKHDAAKELATEKGSVADYKLALDNEKEAMTLLKHSFEETNNKRLLESAVNDFSGVLADDPAGRMYMQSQFNSLVEVKDGVVVPKDVTTKLEDLKQSLITDKANAKYIKANVGSGVGSAGSDGEFNTVKLPKDMNGQERMEFKQNDPTGFKKAFNLN